MTKQGVSSKYPTKDPFKCVPCDHEHVATSVSGGCLMLTTLNGAKCSPQQIDRLFMFVVVLIHEIYFKKIHIPNMVWKC